MDKEHPDESLRAIGRIAFGLILLANSAKKKWIEGDCLRSDESKYAEGDENERSRCVERCRKRSRMTGHVVGRFIRLPRVVKENGCARTGSGSPLQYRHWRSGHWHTVRYGPGRVEEVVDWFLPTLVKPDLPPDPRKRTYVATFA